MDLYNKNELDSRAFIMKASGCYFIFKRILKINSEFTHPKGQFAYSYCSSGIVPQYEYVYAESFDELKRKNGQPPHNNIYLAIELEFKKV